MKGDSTPSGITQSRTHSKVWTLSNIITLFRICLVPVFIVALLSPWPEWFNIPDIIDDQVKAWISAGIFIAISCTDWIDGYLARKRSEVTDFGKFLDPLADKILVAAALIALVELDYLPSWPALIILTREFIVSGIRMMASSRGIVIAASWYGKVKTVLQIIAIVLFIIKGETDTDLTTHMAFYIVAWAFMIAALVMTVISMMEYIAKATPILFPKSSEEENASGPDATDLSELKRRIDETSSAVILKALDASITLCTAESLTGGLVSASLTSVPGSSNAVKGAIVTYVNSMKSSLLGVDQHILDTLGPVCGECAEQMASGVRKRMQSDIAVSVTGLAGPGGGSVNTPVGTVYMGISTTDRIAVEHFVFEGDRESVRLQTVLKALEAFDKELERSA